MSKDRPKSTSKKKQSQSSKIISAYKKTFSGPEGDVVLEDLMKSCGFFGTTFVPGDSHHTAYSEGARSVVLRILQTIEITSEEMRKIFENLDNGVYDDEDDQINF